MNQTGDIIPEKSQKKSKGTRRKKDVRWKLRRGRGLNDGHHRVR
jgi:hypothetical protein